jgi:hypothetical protein
MGCFHVWLLNSPTFHPYPTSLRSLCQAIQDFSTSLSGQLSDILAEIAQKALATLFRLKYCA